MNLNRTLAAIALFALSLRLAAATSLGTAFTYQGRLLANGNPATGLYDFQVALYDAATGTNSFGTNTLTAVAVANGLYTIALDFGSSVFDGNARFLDFSVRTNSDPNWTALAPRQPVSPTPYALRASGLIGTLPDSQLSSNIPRLNGANAFTGPNAFNGALFVTSTSVVANLDADLLDGLHGSGYALAAHTHAATDIVSGTLPSGRLAGTYSNALNLNNPGNVFVGDGVGISGITSTPAGAAGGSLAGTYPNPTIASGAITDSMVSVTANISASKIFGGDLGAARLKVGSSHTLSGNGATIGGGMSNIVDAAAAFATIPGGAQGRASSYGQQAYSTGSFVTNGDAQSSLFILRNTTTNAAQTELFLDSVGQRILIPTNGNWAIDVLIVARSAAGYNVAYDVKGLIYKVGANLSSVVSIPLLRGSSANYGPASSSDVTVAADSAHSALVVTVVSPYGSSLTRWVATVRTVEVIN
jgi:hypothetical protein